MFSKYDVYTTVQSMYCYPDTDVLINKLNIRDKAELKQAEEEFTAVKQMALLQEPIKGRFTKTHLFRIHRFLFEDVYPFAGHIRKEQISKGDTMFYPPDLIDRETLINAAIAAVDDDMAFCDVLRQCIETDANKT